MADSKSSGGASATQDRQDKTDAALKNERDSNGGDDRYGGSEPLPYPETEVQDSVTYRDPRPLDWPQKADRSVYVGPVLKADPDDEDDPKGDYVYLNQIDRDDQGTGEVELGGTLIEHFQVVSGSGQVNLIINGETFVGGTLSTSIQSELATANQMNANS